MHAYSSAWERIGSVCTGDYCYQLRYIPFCTWQKVLGKFKGHFVTNWWSFAAEQWRHVGIIDERSEGHGWRRTLQPGCYREEVTAIAFLAVPSLPALLAELTMRSLHRFLTMKQVNKDSVLKLFTIISLPLPGTGQEGFSRVALLAHRWTRGDGDNRCPPAVVQLESENDICP